MTHKQVKIGKSKKSRKVKQVEDEYESRGTRRRALLLSSDDVERMAVESSRARLINHLVSKSEDHSHKEFASYYRGSSKHLEPPCSITSHANRVPILKVPYVIPAYQSLIQSPRWCPPTMTTSPQGSYTETMEIPPYICKCANCTSSNCPGRNNNASKLPKFRSNIRTFCDQCTMTRNVHDVACGRTPVPSTPIYSDAVAPCCSSMFAIIDDHCKHVHGRNAVAPSPILKRGCMNCMKKKAFCDIETGKTKSVKCFFKKERDESSGCEEVISRKNIYNEGISDVVTGRFAPCSRTLPASPRCSSRTSISSSSRNSNNIPHSHKNESKYHRHCVDPPDRVYVQDNYTETTKCHYTVAIPKLVARGTCGARTCRRHAPVAHNIKMPKKVLMSERVLDHGTDRIPCNKMPCRRK